MKIKDMLFKSLTENPASITYIGIGSCPEDIKNLNNMKDQIIPKFMTEKIKKNVETIKIIHFDPAFSMIKKSQLNDYFISKNLNLYNYPEDGISTWKSINGEIEINIVSDFFIHKTFNEIDNDDDFLMNVIEVCLLYESQLIVQEYTGYKLCNLFLDMYEKSENKDLFKKKILFDVSYDQDCHCFIDLQNHFPLYDKNNDFLNILLFSYEEFLTSIGFDKNIDKIIKFHFIDKLKKIETENIPDFRRKILKMEIQKCSDYDENVNDKQILDIIKKKIDAIFKVLEKLKVIKINDYIYRNVFFNHKKYKDPYVWFDDYRKCYDII